MTLGIAVIEYKVDPAHAAEVNRRLLAYVVEEAHRIAGYLGWLTADLGNGTRRDIWIFESVDALQGMAQLDKVAREQLVPLTGEPERILTGGVIMTDGVLAVPNVP